MATLKPKFNIGDGLWATKQNNLLGWSENDASKFSPKEGNFLRSTTGSYTDKNGVLQTGNSVTLSEQVVGNPDFNFDEPFWESNSPDVYLENGYLFFNGCDLGASISNALFSLPSGRYIFSTDVFDSFSELVTITICGQAKTFADEGVYEWTFDIDGETNGISITADGDGTDLKLLYLHGFKIVSESTNVETPRIDYSTDSNGALLLEDSSSNLLAYSEDFSKPMWVKSDAVISVNDTIAPDGVSISQDFNFSASETASVYTQFTSDDIEHEAGSGMVFSVWLKSKTVDGNFEIGLYQVGNENSKSVNLSATEWRRFEIGYIAIDDTNILVVPALYIGNNQIQEVSIWGAQFSTDKLEATSYIQTTGVSASRGRESASSFGSQSDFLGVEGTLYFEASMYESELVSSMISLSDGTEDNRIAIILHLDNTVEFSYFKDGVAQSILLYDDPFVFDFTRMNKFAYSFKDGNFLYMVNGKTLSFDVTGQVAASGTMTHINFSNGEAFDELFNGEIKAVKYYDKFLTPTELYNLTTNGYLEI